MTVGELRTFLVTNTDMADDSKRVMLWDPENGCAVSVQRVELRMVNKYGGVAEPHAVGDETNALLVI